MASNGFTPQQVHTIAQIYGHQPTQLELNQISGNGRLQQYLNQRAALLGLPTPVFAPSTRSAIAQDLLPLLGQLGGIFGPAESSAGAGAEETAVAGAGGAAAGTGAGAASNVFKVAKFAAAADFLSYIAWIFHPQTLLRIVEFIVGFVLMGWGIYILTSSSARRSSGASSVVRRSIQATPGLGRVVRTQQGRRMGRREGQREAARMEARQRETYSQRQASAVEREQINRNARTATRS